MVWDTFDTYRLRKDELGKYLVKCFGPCEFYIQVKGDVYVFWIPQLLTAGQREKILDLRWGDST
ncbi:hypothetical protein CC78DRAFT_581206 [Lojkania enalia]|uniref:Uncharacterized protein n=1 Tax=Lojkania enalia TaxID=147567 RepID=A0A9P4K829_9PLEO|nr:hypothetical protein CC78DRAFT_581206 [Didymosphaeria enalia]